MKSLMKTLNLLLIAFLSLQLVSCGTILYPERRNQDPGRIDVGVALLDGFWLLVGIIPGLIAFGVDFSTGAIYVPEYELGHLDRDNYKVVRFDPENTSKEELEELISEATHQEFSFSDERYQMTRINGKEDLDRYLDEVE